MKPPYAYIVPPELDERTWRPDDLRRIKAFAASAWWRTTALAYRLTDELKTHAGREVSSQVIHRAIGKTLRVNATRIRHAYMLRYESLSLLERRGRQWLVHPERVDIAHSFGAKVLARLQALYPEESLLAEPTLHDLARSHARSRLGLSVNVPPPVGEVPNLDHFQGDPRVAHNTPAYGTAFDLRMWVESLWPHRENTPNGPKLEVSTQWLRERQQKAGLTSGAAQVQRLLDLGTQLGVFQRTQGMTTVRFRYAPIVNRWAWLRFNDVGRVEKDVLETMAERERSLHEDLHGKDLSSTPWQEVVKAWEETLKVRVRLAHPAIAAREMFVVGKEFLDINPPHIADMLEPPPTLGENLVKDASTALETGMTEAVCLVNRVGDKSSMYWVFPKGSPAARLADVRQALQETQPDFAVYISRDEMVKMLLDDAGKKAREEIASYSGRITFLAPQQRVSLTSDMHGADNQWVCEWWRPNPASLVPDSILELLLTHFDCTDVHTALALDALRPPKLA